MVGRRRGGVALLHEGKDTTAYRGGGGREGLGRIIDAKGKNRICFEEKRKGKPYNA